MEEQIIPIARAVTQIILVPTGLAEVVEKFRNVQWL